MLPTSGGKRHGSIWHRVVIRHPPLPTLVPAVAWVDVKHDDPASAAAGNANVQVGVLFPPALDLFWVFSRVVNTVGGSRDLAIRYYGQDTPAPFCISQRCFNLAHGLHATSPLS